MEKFIKFKENINIKMLSKDVSDDRIIILRESKTTGTIQVKILGKMSTHQIKKSFKPHKITKIYDEFPYPTAGKRQLLLNLSKVKNFLSSTIFNQ